MNKKTEIEAVNTLNYDSSRLRLAVVDGTLYECLKMAFTEFMEFSNTKQNPKSNIVTRDSPHVTIFCYVVIKLKCLVTI